MAATFATLTAVGRSGKFYSVDCAVPDAAGGIVSFNPAGLAVAGANSYWRTPEDVLITDFSIITGATAVGGVITSSGAVVNGAALRYNVQLNTLATRPKLAIPIKAGELLGITNF